MRAKTWWQSKTVWANIAYVAAMLLQALVDVEVIPPLWQGGLLAVANLVLRVVTDRPITLRGRPMGPLIREPMGGSDHQGV